MRDESYKRSNHGRFAKGNRGGPGRLSGEQRAAANAAVRDTLTPDRIRIIVASLLKAVIERQDVSAARLLLDRALGRPRAESANPMSMDLPDGLASPHEIAVAAHSLLRALAEGEISPEDAHRSAMVVDTARKAVETEELAKRVAELEKRAKRRTN
jgi:hypothetical protein